MVSVSAIHHHWLQQPPQTLQIEPTFLFGLVVLYPTSSTSDLTVLKISLKRRFSNYGKVNNWVLWLKDKPRIFIFEIASFGMISCNIKMFKQGKYRLNGNNLHGCVGKGWESYLYRVFHTTFYPKCFTQGKLFLSIHFLIAFSRIIQV